MIRELLLFKALQWALKNGINAYSIDGKLSINGNGCGCCEEPMTPPDEIAEIIKEAAEKF